MKKSCEYCGHEFETKKQKTRFCSIQCVSRATTEERIKKTMATKRAKWATIICPYCGVSFTPKPRKGRETQKRFCSKKCYSLHHSADKTLREQAKASGLKTYSAGQPCEYGHMAERYTSRGVCVECTRLQNENRKDYYKDWVKQNRDHLKAQRRQHYLENREELLRASKEYLKNNPQGHRESNKRYRATEKGRVMYQAAWQKRRAIKIKAPGNFRKEDWLALVARSPRCHWCKRPFNKKRRPTHDHVTPLFRGGMNTLENSVCACAECNSRKGFKLEDPITGQGILL